MASQPCVLIANSAGKSTREIDFNIRGSESIFYKHI